MSGICSSEISGCADGNTSLEPTGRLSGSPTTRTHLSLNVKPCTMTSLSQSLVPGSLVLHPVPKRLGLRTYDCSMAGDVGGVWYRNRYPGAMRDTAAMIYLPLLEETGTVPSAKYVPAHEIFAHAQLIATTFGLYENAPLSTSATEVSWDVDVQRWRITTDRGDNFNAKYGNRHRAASPRFAVLMALTLLRATHFTRAVGTTTIAGAGLLMCQWTTRRQAR